jgi:hypothetical protein
MCGVLIWAIKVTAIFPWQWLRGEKAWRGKLEQIIGNLVIQEGETDEASTHPSTAYRKWFVG